MNKITEHSRQLKIQTSKEWKKQNIKQITIQLNKSKDADVIEYFSNMKGSNTEKLKELISVYKKIQ